MDNQPLPGASSGGSSQSGFSMFSGASPDCSNSELCVVPCAIRGAVRGGLAGLALSGLYALYNTWDHLKGIPPTHY